jgi:hypothetical protein
LPPNVTDKQRAAVEARAQAVLNVRQQFPAATLADLYDPLAMPPELLRAHTELDRAVEKCYRAELFHSDRERVEFLFSLYEKLTAPLLPVTPKTRGRRSSRNGGTATVQRPSRQRTPPLPGQNQNTPG